MAHEAASPFWHHGTLSSNSFAPATARFAAQSPAYPDIRAHLKNAAQLLTLGADELSLAELETIREELKTIVLATRTHTAAKLLVEIKDRIAPLGCEGAETFGQDFIDAFERCHINVRLDPEIPCNATYCSYTYKEDRRGLINEVAVNPERVDATDKFTISVAHEIFHGLQKAVSPALQLSPFNPDSTTIVHPADWIHLEQLCERDAFTKDAFVTTLMSVHNPALHKHDGLISTKEVIAQIEKHPSLADAMVAIALTSLERPYDRAHPRGKSYVDHYHEVAIRNYGAGIWNHHNDGKKVLKFVRLELDDFRQVGNYGVGPNSFGEHVAEPLIAKRSPLSPDSKIEYDEMCKEYNIPPLEQCQTLREHRKSTGQASAPALETSGRTHAATAATLSMGF